MREGKVILLSVLALFGASELTAQSVPEHFIYFGLERDRITEPAFLSNPNVAGAQLKFTWPELEPIQDAYAFDGIEEASAFLERHGKQLFIQIQDVSFQGDIINVPQYLLDDEAYHGGVARQHIYEEGETPIPEGWVARRWDPAVQQRFTLLLQALGEAFDGQLAGITLPETSIGMDPDSLHPAGYTHAAYYEAVKRTMEAAKAAFPNSHVIQYANFMPGEAVPEHDQGYLRGIYAFADSLNIGIGGPDLLPFRWWQRQHSYPLIANRSPGTIAGVAVQHGNLDDVHRRTGERATVELLYEYASQELKLDYIFWGIQEPHYSESILPFLEDLHER